MPTILDPTYAGGTSLGSYYEGVLRTTLANLWRRRVLVATFVAAAVVIGLAIAIAVPDRYTAEAYIGGFTTGDNAGGATVDAAMLVETQARLIGSHQLARRVVDRIGLERVSPALSRDRLSSFWHSIFPQSSQRTSQEFQDDLAASKLLEGLLVKTEPRVYLITLQYTSGNPDLAALIVNTFVTEFLRSNKLQSLSQQRDLARLSLEQLTTLGQKHPKVIDAKTRLQAADVLLTAEENKTNEEIKRSAGGNVTFAQASAVPSGPNRKAIVGFAVVLGLIGGITLVSFNKQRSLG